MQEDTIAAISTPLGEGGIGIIRVSGTQVLAAAKKIFQTKNNNGNAMPSHRMIYGHIFDLYTNEVVDEVLLCYMKAPRSYTREDVVEIHCHGGLTALKKILELVLAQGVRLAEPGEFSKRAFLNGRLDLAQAESVIDLIRAKTEAGLKLAAKQLKGGLSEKINDIQNRLLSLLAQIEVNIDFPDDDTNEVISDTIINTMESLMAEIEHLLHGAETGIIYREGLKAVIMGRPNVGKSSLLNALLREKRAIVTDVPGTTRDIIEEVINIKGIPLRLIDTAGLRKTDDLVEKIGVERTKEAIEQADLLLPILDAGQELSQQDLDVLALTDQKKALIIVNKNDLNVKKVSNQEIHKFAPDKPVVWLSAKNETGLRELESTLAELFLHGKTPPTADLLVTNIRHKIALEKSVYHLKEAFLSLNNLVPIDIVAIDLREVGAALGEITGSTVSEDLIDKIFSDFCVGK